MKEGSHSCSKILGIYHIYVNRLAAQALLSGTISEVGVFTCRGCRWLYWWREPSSYYWSSGKE